MKITKQGEPPSTTYAGRCEDCGCEFECTREEARLAGQWRWVDCPCCRASVEVRRVTALQQIERKLALRDLNGDKGAT